MTPNDPPYPCDGCDRNIVPDEGRQTLCNKSGGWRQCSAWLQQYRLRQARINNYAKAHGIEPTTKIEEENC